MPYPVSTTSFFATSDHNDIQSTIYDIVGLGANGYGITDFDTRPVTGQFVVNASAWKSMLNTLDRIKRHQTDQNLYYGSTQTNELILAKTTRVDGVLVRADLHNFINTTTQELLVGRYTVHPNQLSPVISTGGSSVRQNDWTSQTIEHVVEVSWPTELIARYFFNLGGYLTINAGHENNSFGGNNDAWKALVASIPAQLYTRSDFVSVNQTKTYSIVNGVAPYSGLTYRAVATKVSASKIVFSITFIDAVALTPPPPPPVSVPSILVMPSSARWNVLLQPTSSFTVINPLPGQGIYSDIGPSLDDVALIFNPNGTFRVESEYGLASFSGNWGTPTTITAGSTHWIRFTPIGTVPPGVVATGWLSLSSIRQVIVNAVANAGQGLVTRNVSYQVDISSSGSGSPIVTSGIYTLEANATNSLFNIVTPLPSNTFSNDRQSQSSVVLTFSSNGQFSAKGIGYITEADFGGIPITYEQVQTTYGSPYNWGLPTTPGVGQNYWIRFIKISDSLTGITYSDEIIASNASESTGWLRLSEDQSVFVYVRSFQMGGTSGRTATYNVSISASASDSGIIAAGTFILSTSAFTPESFEN